METQLFFHSILIPMLQPFKKQTNKKNPPQNPISSKIHQQKKVSLFLQVIYKI